ncbi:ferredoxin [Moraxella cuniculi DSM 21768]|uniref:Ferredoxin n=1 Tax=Moraxella cuniculi DSM 21768 TaxID=1122245 RepID=A0A1N7FJA1_9GAMM|nr:2Fe-2S iron-sulfur cluster-binding protein [Moraxella cuniculi]OOS02353.1 (2Fe-2S)-binding protein [Moraxella cuniculi]SIS00403.1 ferredoxin [Moraxella cuniculi DSM 21768]
MGWVFTDEMRFYLHEHETLLNGMIRTQHKQVRYECQEGYCGSCRMTVVAHTGEVKYIKKPIATLADNEVLACCCTFTGTTQVSYHAADEQQLPLFDSPNPPKSTT